MEIVNFTGKGHNNGYMIPFEITKCVNCEKGLEYNTLGRKYCSNECRRIVWKNKYRDKYRKKVGVDPEWAEKERTCVLCKSSFLPKTINQKYCKRECYGEANSFDYIYSNQELLVNTPRNKWLKLRIKIFDRDGFICRYCGRGPMKDDGVVLHVDHKIPKKHGGSDLLDNLITSCEQCNLGKGDLLLGYWKEK